MGAEFVPAREPDPMTGEGGKQYPDIRFTWRITEGEHADQTVSRDTPVPKDGGTVKCAYVQFAGFVMGKQLAPDDEIDLPPFVGRKYSLTVGQKTDKNGKPKNWTHVTNAALLD